MVVTPCNNFSPMSGNRVPVEFYFENQKWEFSAFQGKTLTDPLLQFTKKELFCIKIGENKIIPIGLNLVVKTSLHDDSKANLYYSDEEIISNSDFPLKIRAERISKSFYILINFIYVYIPFCRLWN